MRLILLLCLLLSIQSVMAKQVFNVCWSSYVGWEPWGYAEQSGVLDGWASKYGIEIRLQKLDDYLGSIEAYTKGEFDACTMTQMDALTIPAAQGVDTSVIIIGDYSDGNDGIVSRSAGSIKALMGKEVFLVKHSVSHYLLARALAQVGMSERDVELRDAADSDLVSLLKVNKDAAIVTWNPVLQEALAMDGTQSLFDSSNLPGEILDVMVVRTEVDERLKKALAGAWYEVMARMRMKDAGMLASMASDAGVSLSGFQEQLETTRMFYSAGKASRTAKSKATVNATRKLMAFCLEQGLLTSEQPLGVSFGTRIVLGNPNNIKLRFDNHYMRLAAQRAL